MQYFWVGSSKTSFPGNNERGAILVAGIVILVVLMGVSTIATYSGYTNLLTATNLRLATSARVTAEANINEAIYRLSLPQGTIGAIVPDFSDADWQAEIVFDDTPGTNQVTSLQTLGDWPDDEFRSDTKVTLEYKKDENDNLVFYNRSIAETEPPFLKVTLPDILVPGLVDPLAALLDEVYGVLCMLNVGGVQAGGLLSIGLINVGGILGLCPANTQLPDIGYPVIEIHGTGVNARGAEREFLAEAVRTVKFTPLAPLSAGGAVNLNSNGFIDGVNHHPDIHLTGGSGTGARYGDDDTETTQAGGGLINVVVDSPDDNDLWLSGLLNLNSLGLAQHSIANVSLLLNLPLQWYTSMPRIYNRQIASGNTNLATTPAWVGVSPLAQNLNQITLTGYGVGNILVPIVNLGVWEEVNSGYRAPIALSATATVQNAPTPAGQRANSLLDLIFYPSGTNPNNLVWNSGIFTWRNNNKNDTNFRGSTNLTTDIPAVNTVRECGPTIQGDFARLTCRPAFLADFAAADDDWFQDYLGLDDSAFQNLLDDPDTVEGNINSTGPIGFSYADSSFTWSSGNPGTSQFGLLYVDGNLNVSGTRTFKGLIFVDGNLTINSSAHLTVLGAVMVRGNVTNSGSGKMTLLYSREAANRGLQTAHPWRILSWADTAVQEEAQ